VKALEPPVLVGVDLGTSAVKVLACTPDGKTVAEASSFYPLETPRPGWVEQDANVVYAATMKTVHDVLAQVHLRGNHVGAIGFSSAMHGVLPVDANGEPAGQLITWMDRRSADVAERWRADGTADQLYARTGAPIHPMLPSCKLRWLSENEPDAFARAARFVSMKELLVYRWTGNRLIRRAGSRVERPRPRTGARRPREALASRPPLDQLAFHAPNRCERARTCRTARHRTGVE
jgi:gluconokinase